MQNVRKFRTLTDRWRADACKKPWWSACHWLKKRNRKPIRRKLLFRQNKSTSDTVRVSTRLLLHPYRPTGHFHCLWSLIILLEAAQRRRTSFLFLPTPIILLAAAFVLTFSPTSDHGANDLLVEIVVPTKIEYLPEWRTHGTFKLVERTKSSGTGL